MKIFDIKMKIIENKIKLLSNSDNNSLEKVIIENKKLKRLLKIKLIKNNY